MNENDARRLAELLEAIALSEALELLVAKTEDISPGDERQIAMLIFFRSLLNKYKRQTRNVRIKTDAYGDVQIVDEQLRRFFDN